VDHLLVAQVFKPLTDLEDNPLQVQRLEYGEFHLIGLHVLVEIQVQHLENDNYVLSEFEVIKDFNDTVAAFNVTILAITTLLQFLEELYLDVGVVNIELLVLRYFSSDNWFI